VELEDEDLRDVAPQSGTKKAPKRNAGWDASIPPPFIFNHFFFLILAFCSTPAMLFALKTLRNLIKVLYSGLRWL
jgi:hypothetical protein